MEILDPGHPDRPVLLGHIEQLIRTHHSLYEHSRVVRIMFFADPELTDDKAAAVVGDKVPRSAVEAWTRFLKEHDSASAPVIPTLAL